MSEFSIHSAKLLTPEPQTTAIFGRYFVLDRSQSAVVVTDSSRFSCLKTVTSEASPLKNHQSRKHRVKPTTFKNKSKDLTSNAKAKDMTIEAKAKDKVKDWTYKAKDEAAPRPCLKYFLLSLYW